MNKTINLHVEIECEDDSVDKGKVADLICASVANKFKPVYEVAVYNAEYLPIREAIVKKKKKA